MNIPFVDLNAQYLSIKTEIDAAMAEVFSETRFIGGKYVANFEKQFAKYVGTKFSIACANGTDAIEIALTSLGVGQGDEVIVPAMSWISTASAVHTVGAKPVFVDVLPDVYTMDPSELKKKITPNTLAIIPVHLYGQIARMDEIIKIAREHDLFVIEDSAQAIGSTQAGQAAGTFGDLATFSFYPGKNLGAYGDGGAIVANEEVYAKSCHVMSRLGQRARQDHVALGRNSQLDSLQASVLSVKLKYLDKWNKQRQAIANAYDKLLSDLPVQLPTIEQGNTSNFHLYVVQVPNRNQVVQKMNDQGVACQSHYPKALPYLHPLKTFANGEYPIAKELGESCISLPLYPEMTKEQVKTVSSALHKAI